MTQDCHYDFKLQAEYLQLVGSEMARKAGLGGSFGLTFLFSPGLWKKLRIMFKEAREIRGP